MMQMLQEVPGADELVEEGKTMQDCFVDPEPAFPPQDSADAVGDPHLTTIYGEKLDLERVKLH